jgi:hypothetical protein
LNAVTVALSYSVAVNVLFPILSLILLPVGFVLLLLLLFAREVFLLQDAQLTSETAKNASISNCFIITAIVEVLVMHAKFILHFL